MNVQQIANQNRTSEIIFLYFAQRQVDRIALNIRTLFEKLNYSVTPQAPKVDLIYDRLVALGAGQRKGQSFRWKADLDFEHFVQTFRDLEQAGFGNRTLGPAGRTVGFKWNPDVKLSSLGWSGLKSTLGNALPLESVSPAVRTHVTELQLEPNGKVDMTVTSEQGAKMYIQFQNAKQAQAFVRELCKPS